MRPFLVLLGFVLGSTAGISFSLLGVAVVMLVLRGDYPRLDEELGAVLQGFAVCVVLTALAALSFYSELKGRPWRRAVQAALGLVLAAIAGAYWPS